MIPLASAIFLFPAIATAGEFVWFKPWTSTLQLAEVLKTVSAGRAILLSAEKKDPKILEHVRLGAVSFTENVTIASDQPFDEKNHTLHSQKITLNSHQKLSDAVAEFSHELFHFTERKFSDPYEDGLVLAKFIRNGIEGPGGELKAFAYECKVSWELEKTHPAFPRHEFCARYRGKDGSFNEEAARLDYYALSLRWLEKIGPDLREKIPELNGKPAVFTSGVNGRPYPLVLQEEFYRIRATACESNRSRYSLTAVKPKIGRIPSKEEILAERKKLEDFDRRNCKNNGGTKASANSPH